MSRFLSKKCVVLYMSTCLLLLINYSKVFSFEIQHKASTIGLNDLLDTNYTQLLDNIEPINYNLLIKTYFNFNDTQIKREYYEGLVKIKFRVKSSTNIILLNVDQNLNLQQPISISKADWTATILLSRHIKKDFYQLLLAENLSQGEYVLSMGFTNTFDKSFYNEGFFKISYKENSSKRIILATKFQAKNARKVFPCFDEPYMKATFEITVEHPENTQALSNWPEKSKKIFKEYDSNRIRTIFDTTYRMPTYQVSWVIAPYDFTYISTQTEKNKTIRVFAKKSAIDKGYANYGLETAKKSVDFLENNILQNSDAVPPKIDILNLPINQQNYYENYGLTYLSESELLYSSLHTHLLTQQQISLIIAKKMAQLWFGNFLSVPNWNDIWLKESISHYLAYQTVDFLNPEWNILSQIGYLNQLPLFYQDAFPSSFPLVNDNNLMTSSDLYDLYTSINNAKGLSILNMYQSMMGQDHLKNVLKNLLNSDHSGHLTHDLFYNNTDLPDEIGNVSSKSFFDSWLYQQNYPEVLVVLSYEDLGSTKATKINFKQSRFLLQAVNKSEQPDFTTDNSNWIIYLKCLVGGEFIKGSPQYTATNVQQIVYLLKEHEGYIKLAKEYTWIKCNSDFHGYYLTNYDNKNFEALNNLLRNDYSALSIGDKVDLIHSSYILPYKGSKSYDLIKNISDIVASNEYSYAPIGALKWHLKKLADLMQYRPSYRQLSKFGASISKKISKGGKKSIWDDSGSHMERLINSDAIDLSCKFEDQSCISNVLQQFQSIPIDYFTSPNDISNVNIISQNQRSLIYKYYMYYMYSQNDWFSLYSLYQSSIMPHELQDSLVGLAYCRSPWLLESLLTDALKSNSVIQTQDFYTLLTFMGENPIARDLAWENYKQNIIAFTSNYGYNLNVITALNTICGSFGSQYQFNDFMNTFPINFNDAFYLYIKHLRYMILNNMDWIKFCEPNLLQIFN